MGRYIANRDLTVGTPDGGVIEYAEGDEVKGAEAFTNLDGLLADGILVEGKAPRAKPKAKAAPAGEGEGTAEAEPTAKPRRKPRT